MGASGNDGSSIYQYGNSAGVDQGFQKGLNSLSNAPQPGVYQQAIGQDANLLKGTNYTAQQGVNAGNAIQGNVANQNLGGMASQALATGFNQNNGLYNQELQQITDQTRAGQAARGISMSPYGAGVEGQTLTNFNNTWNNQQLQNQAVAAQTAGALDSLYGTQTALGASTAQNAANNPLNALSSLMTSGVAAYQPREAAMSDRLQYLSGGTQAGAAQAQAANQSAQIQNSMLGGLGSLAGSLGGKAGGGK